MRRRQLMRYAQMGLLAAMGSGLATGWQTSQAQTQKPRPQSPQPAKKPAKGLSIQWLGHTCFLFTGGGKRILVNPFKSIGCTAGYREPRVQSDLVMISSQLLDEGFLGVIPGNPRLLMDPGAYSLPNLKIQGIATDHDRVGGRRFGRNITWLWQQEGITILHLGGIAAPISLEQRILMGRPDVLILPVGGGPKAYSPEEAKRAIQTLNPKIVIPTHYLTQAANKEVCDLSPLDNFLSLMSEMPTKRATGNEIILQPKDLPTEGSVIQILSYKF